MGRAWRSQWCGVLGRVLEGLKKSHNWVYNSNGEVVAWQRGARRNSWNVPGGTAIPGSALGSPQCLCLRCPVPCGAGVVTKMKMQRTIVIRRDYLHYIRKYNRFEKRHKNMSVHLSPCFRCVHVSPRLSLLVCGAGLVQTGEAHLGGIVALLTWNVLTVMMSKLTMVCRVPQLRGC